MNETGEQIEFTPTELNWWTFKFIILHPIWTFRFTVITWWKG